MKKVKKITLCGIIAALITTVCLAAYFPYLTYALPAVAGAFIMVPLFEIGKKYALFTYLASFLPVAFFCENEAKLMYLCFFGFYPILKAVFEGLKSRIVEYILKLICFNAAVTLIYFGLAGILGIPKTDFGAFYKYGVGALYLLGNVAFVLYDICLTRLGVLYVLRIKKHISRFLK